MSQISAAFRSFFSLLFSGVLPEDIALEYGFVKARPAPVDPTPAPPKINVSDGALTLLHVLQRDARLVDFLMEDISSYSDDQVGAAVRAMHSDGKASLGRHFTLHPVIDSVEGTFQQLNNSTAPNPGEIKLIGNVPLSGKVAGGTLRHRGWRAVQIDLPTVPKQDAQVIAPAELEVE